MPEIDLRKDAVLFREALEQRVKQFEDEGGPLSAIEVGYDIDQGCWIFIHADRRPEHTRDGEWTGSLDDEDLLEMPHWLEAIEAMYEAGDLSFYCFDGTHFTLNEDGESEDAGETESSIEQAVGKMIYAVLMQAKADGVFDRPGWAGKVQLDIEDFNGAWGWPAYEKLGKTNLV